MSRVHSIWIVSSDERWVEQISKRLGTMHLGARKFASATAAADHLEQGEQPSLILLQGDHNWQETLAACGRLVDSQTFRPILVVDSECDPAVRLRFLEKGADECVPPPQLVPRMSAYLLRTLSQGTPAHRAPAQAVATKTEPPTPSRDDQSHMYMRLGPGELSDALQFLTMSPRTGELRLRFIKDGAEGHVFLKDGDVVHVEFKGHTGTEAFARMLLHGDGEARFHADEEAVERTVRKSVSQLLLEAAVSADEMHA